MTYRHPTYSPATVAAQRQLAGLNNDRLAFAGAYQGWGFHEDGCRSGVEAARALGVEW
jgi:predicted NAD/FAD-binding protein